MLLTQISIEIHVVYVSIDVFIFDSIGITQFLL